MSKKSTAVAKARPNALAPADLMADQGAGMEEIGAEDVAVPYLSIIQQLSGYVKSAHENYIEDATAGELINSISLERYTGEGGVAVIPCYFRQVWNEYGPGKRGDFVTEHPASTELALQTTRNADGQDELPSKNVLVRTARHFCLMADTLEPVVITMRSSQLRTSKRWNSLLSGRRMEGIDGEKFTPPTYSSIWHIGTMIQTKGDDSWFGFKVTPWGDVESKEDLMAGRRFYQMCNGGDVRTSESEYGE